MKPEPLPQSIYDRARALQVKKLILAFSGGRGAEFFEVFFDELDAPQRCPAMTNSPGSGLRKRRL
jgi:hypothetical protein